MYIQYSELALFHIFINNEIISLFGYSLPLDLITEEELIDEILNKENEDSKNIVKNEQDIIHDETADSDNGKEVYKALIQLKKCHIL